MKATPSFRLQQRQCVANSAQKAAVLRSAVPHQKTAQVCKWLSCKEMRKDTAPCENTELLLMGDKGLELNYVTPCNDKKLQDLLESGGAKSGASTLIEADLQQLVEAWSSLPKNIRSAIVAIVQNGAD